MLINHPTDGATRDLTLRVSLLGQNKNNNKLNKIFFFFFFLPKNLLSLLSANKVEYGTRIDVKTHHT